MINISFSNWLTGWFIVLAHRQLHKYYFWWETTQTALQKNATQFDLYLAAITKTGCIPRTGTMMMKKNSDDEGMMYYRVVVVVECLGQRAPFFIGCTNGIHRT